MPPACRSLSFVYILLLLTAAFACGFNVQSQEVEGLHTDWMVVGYGMDPEEPKSGETVRFYVMVGIATLIEPLPQTVEVVFILDGRHYVSAPLTFKQDPKEVLKAQVSWVATAGEHYVEWIVDPNRQYDDPNPANNHVAFQFTVTELEPPYPATILVTETSTKTVTVTHMKTLTEQVTTTVLKEETRLYTVTEKTPVYHPTYPLLFLLLMATLALTAWIKYELHRYRTVPTAPPPLVTAPPTMVERCPRSIDVFMTNLPRGTRTVKWTLKDREGEKIGEGVFDTSKGPGIIKDTFRATLEGLKEGQEIIVELIALDKKGRVLAKASGCGTVCRDKEIEVNFPTAKEVTGNVKDGKYEWSYKYLQIGNEVILRLKLRPDPDVSKEELKELKERWRRGIEEKWSGKFGCCNRGDVKDGKCVGCSYSLITLRVEFVEDGEHATIRVRRGPRRSNYITWDTEDTGDVAAHEVGHHLGLKDEYKDPNVPARTPVDTGTVMDDTSKPTVKRHYEKICNGIGKVVVEKR